MTVTVTDPTLLAALQAEGDIIELKHPDGRVLAVFATGDMGVPPPGMKSPVSDEELAELKKQKTGRPLADILADLRKLR
jgi:hypothetical protein